MLHNRDLSIGALPGVASKSITSETNTQNFGKLHIKSNIPQNTIFEIPQIQHEFGFKELINLDTSKAVDIDGFSANILKMVAPIIASCLTKSMTLSITSGNGRTTCEQTKTFVIFSKKNNIKEVSNYRPICVLYVNIIRKHVHAF